jgi:hypothetical protein
MKPVDQARTALVFPEDETREHVCPGQIDIDEQIYAWREVMDSGGGFSATKKAAVKVADAVLSHPRVYRAAGRVRRCGTAGAAALRDLQPAQRLGAPPRRDRRAEGDLSPVVRPQPRNGRPLRAAVGNENS